MQGNTDLWLLAFTRDLRVADRGGGGVGLSAIRESTIAIEHEEVRCAGGAERLGDLLALIVKSRGM